MRKTMVGLPDYHQLVGNWTAEGLKYLTYNFPTRCTLHCPKCALDEETANAGTPLTLKEQTQIFAAAKAAGALTLVVIGMGEPTEHPEIMLPGIEQAHRLGMTSIVFSTLNRMDYMQAKFYAEHGTSIVVSLDSLDPRLYRQLTGGGELGRVLENLALLRQVYAKQPDHNYDREGWRVLRLGLITTVVTQNVQKLQPLDDLADNDMFRVANPPMAHGQFERERLWNKYIAPGRLVRRSDAQVDGSYGSEWQSLLKIANQHSDSGGRSSITNITGGLCAYFSRGVAVHLDGEWLGPCTYATETAGTLGSAKGALPEDVLAHYRRMRGDFADFTAEIGRTPACPLRDPAFNRLVQRWPTR